MKKNYKLLCVTLLCSFLVSTALACVLMNQPDSRDREFSLMLAGRVNDAVIDEIISPLLVARTMAHSTVLADWLLTESERTQEENADYMKNYLSELQSQFGYTSAFLVSDASRCYYTFKGLNKVVNPLDDPHDMWYPTFTKKNVAYDISADIDQVNDAQWTIFINCAITGPDGKFLGVCGVGETMQDLQQILHAYENQYKAKINLVDTNGLVQLSSNASSIQRLYLNNIKLDSANDTYSVLEDSRGFRISKYLKDLGWYLIVQTGNSKTASKLLPFLPWNLFGHLFLLALLLLAQQIARSHEKEEEAQSDTIDALTNLPNRNYFTEAYGETGVFNTTRYKAIVVFDIDHFTSLSAERDGPSIIRGVTDIARRIFEEHGLILHWGGDTFVALLELNMSEALTRCKSFCALVQDEVHVTVSAGLSRVMLVDSIKVNFYRTMQACYEAKAAGGNRVVLGGGIDQ